MADKITKDDIFEGDIFASATKDAKAFEEQLLHIVKTAKDVSAGLNEALKTKRDKLVTVNADDSKKLKEINSEIDKSIKLQKLATDAKIQQLKIEQQVIKTIADERKEITAATKEQEKANKENLKAAKILADNNSEYKKATKALSELKTQLKELEIRGQTGGKLYKALGEEFKVLDAKVRGAEQSVGEFQRNVGNYPKQLKEMQRALQGLEPGTKEFNKLAAEAGQLKDKINDAKDATKAFASESKTQVAKNLFKQIGSDIADLDFKGAADKARQFASVVQSISFSEVVSGIQNFGSAILNIGKALLLNPFVLIVAGIVAIGAAIYKLNGLLSENTAAILENNAAIEEQKNKRVDLLKEQESATLRLLVLQGKLTDTQAKAIAIQENAEKGLKELEEDRIKRIKEIVKSFGAEKGFTQQDVDRNYEFFRSLGLGIDEVLSLKEGLEKPIIDVSTIDFVKRQQAEIGGLVAKFDKSQADTKKGLQDKLNDELKILYYEDASNKGKSEDEKIKKIKQSRVEQIKPVVLKATEDQDIDLRNRIRQAEIDNIEDERLRAIQQLKFNYELSLKEIEQIKATEEQKAALLIELRKKLISDLNKLEKADEVSQVKLLKGKLDESGVAEKEAMDKAKKQAIDDRREVEQLLLNEIQKALDRQNAVKQAAIDRELAQSERAADKQKNLAERGLANTLAFEEAQVAKNQLAKEEQKKQEVRQQKTIAFLRLFASFAERDPNTALSKALVETAIATAITGSFKDGVEDLDGAGTETSDSILARLSKGESVVTAKATKENAGLPTALNEGRVDEYFEQKYLPKYIMDGNLQTTSTATNLHNSALLNQMVGVNNRLKSLEQTLANKREQTVHLDNLGNVIVSHVEKGFTQTTKYKTRKPLI